MSKQVYEVKIPRPCMASENRGTDFYVRFFDLDGLEELHRAVTEAVEKARAEKERHLPWTFAYLERPNDSPCVYIHGEEHEGWSYPYSPMMGGCGIESLGDDFHVLGNLRDIIVNKGPVIIGLTAHEAAILLVQLQGVIWAHDRIKVALDAYESNDPRRKEAQE